MSSPPPSPGPFLVGLNFFPLSFHGLAEREASPARREAAAATPLPLGARQNWSLEGLRGPQAAEGGAGRFLRSEDRAPPWEIPRRGGQQPSAASFWSTVSPEAKDAGGAASRLRGSALALARQQRPLQRLDGPLGVP